MNLTESRRYIELTVPTASLPNRLELDGIKYDAAGVRFEKEIFTVNQVAIMSASMLGESASITLREGKEKKKRKAYQASASDLEIINTRHAEKERSLEDFDIYQRVPVNNVPSRTIGIRFTDRALDKFALDAIGGRARLRSHIKSDIVGRVFNGEVIEDTVRGITGKWLLTTEFISSRTIAGDPMNAELITKRINGEIGYDSIGFYPGSAIEFKELEVEGSRLSIIEIDYDSSEQHPLEMREVSFVHLGELKAVGSHLTSVDELSDALTYSNKRSSVVVSGPNSNLSTWVKSI